MKKKYINLRDRLKPCCGNRPAVEQFIDYYRIKCIIPTNSCRRILDCYEHDEDKLVKLWNFLVKENIPITRIGRDINE